MELYISARNLHFFTLCAHALQQAKKGNPPILLDTPEHVIYAISTPEHDHVSQTWDPPVIWSPTEDGIRAPRHCAPMARRRLQALEEKREELEEDVQEITICGFRKDALLALYTAILLQRRQYKSHSMRVRCITFGLPLTHKMPESAELYEHLELVHPHDWYALHPFASETQRTNLHWIGEKPCVFGVVRFLSFFARLCSQVHWTVYYKSIVVEEEESHDPPALTPPPMIVRSPVSDEEWSFLHENEQIE